MNLRPRRWAEHLIRPIMSDTGVDMAPPSERTNAEEVEKERPYVGNHECGKEPSKSKTSLLAYNTTGNWNCVACGKGGDAVAWLLDQGKINGTEIATYRDAFSYMESRFGVSYLDWPIITPFESREGPPCPIDVLPKSLRNFVEAQAEALQVPTDLLFALVLGTLSAVSSRAAWVKANDGWTEPLNLYICPVLESGEGKTPAYRAAIKPLEELEAEEEKRTRPLRVVTESERDRYSKTADRLNKEAASNPGDKDKQVEANNAAIKLDSHEVIPITHLIVNDITSQALVSVLEEQGGVLTLMSDEPEIFPVMMGKYNDGKEDFDVYLTAYSGKSTLRVARKSRKTESVKNPRLTLLVCLQPAVLIKLASNPDITSRGLAPRISFIFPKSRIGVRKWKHLPTVPSEVIADYRDVIRGIFYLRRSTEEKPNYISPSKAAQDLLENEWTRTETLLQPGRAHYHIREFGSKYAGLTLRLAGNLHLAENYTHTKPWTKKISQDTARNAVKLGRYITQHWLVANGILTSSGEERAQKDIWIQIIANGGTTFSARDIKQKLRSFPDATLNEGLAGLVTSGFIKPLQTPKTLGRPTILYEINPEALANPFPSSDTYDTETLYTVEDEVREEPEPDIPPISYEVVTETARATKIVEELLTEPAVGLDIETTGLHPMTNTIRLVQIASPTAIYLFDLFALPNAPQLLSRVLESGPVKVIQNSKFDCSFLSHVLKTPIYPVYDTMLIDQVVHGRGYGKSLADIADRLLDSVLPKEQQESDWEAQKLTKEQLDYAARDAEVLLPIKDKLDESITESDQRRVEELENRCLPALVWMETSGVGFNLDKWNGLATTAQVRVTEIEARLNELVKEHYPLQDDLFGEKVEKVNWKSPAQVIVVLEKLGFKVQNTRQGTLSEIRDKHPVIEELLNHRGESKKANTYGTKWTRHIDPFDNRIRPNWKQIGAATGRMACSNPNLQNIPRPAEYRACFRADEGNKLVKADYDQIELRIAAELAPDDRMKKAFSEGKDLHETTASYLSGRDEVSSDERQLAKAVNFGLIYGMGAPLLATNATRQFKVDLDEKQARKVRKTYFDTYEGIRNWHRVQGNTTETRTVMGRRRILTGDKDYTNRLNSPVQGTAADGLKWALIKMFESPFREQAKVLLVSAIHDEIVIEVEESRAEEAKEWLTNCMITGMEEVLKEVPVTVSAEVRDTL